MRKVSKEQWEQAQKQELEDQKSNFDQNESGRESFKNTYRHILSCINRDMILTNGETELVDFKGKRILEVGAGSCGFLQFSKNVENSFVLEPLILPENVLNRYKQKHITVINDSAEESILPDSDCVILFNVLQHVHNPDAIIAKLKKTSKQILFFEPLGTKIDSMHLHSFALEDFESYFGKESVSTYIGGSIPGFHTASCAFGTWKKSNEISKNISVIGIGKLGLCFALSLEKSGFNVCGLDLSEEYVRSINDKTYKTSEPYAEEYLLKSKNFFASVDVKQAVEFADILFAVVATPSLANGRYDHSQVLDVVEKIKNLGKQETTKILAITCTVMPGFCDHIQKELKELNWNAVYNPEFIAQGQIIHDQENPDMVLIGEEDKEAGDVVENIFRILCRNNPKFNRMSRTSAELTKIGLNCFLVTKIAYANMLGDISETMGAETEKILKAIGDDSRIGNKFFKYGYGFGGPCLPRDSRVLSAVADENKCNANISLAADEANKLHLIKQTDLFEESNSKSKPITFNSITYKPESILIEESQQLKFAAELAKRGFKVKINERKEVVDLVKKEYGDLFTYKKELPQTNKKVLAFCVFGDQPIYLVGAVENAKLAQIHYPDWQCRFYVDYRVSSDLKQQLRDLGSVVVEKTDLNGYSGLFWRFEPANDPNVLAWVSRDADSRLSEKEALAVQEWLESDRTFHLMRDSHNHDLYHVMAGMFGVRNDLFNKRYSSIDLSCPRHYLGLRDSDQHVLQERLWSLMKNDHICHEHWAHNAPDNMDVARIDRDPKVVYLGQGVVGHVTSRRSNYPDQFAEGSISKPFPVCEEMKTGLYVGQRITESNEIIKNEDVFWEYSLRNKMNLYSKIE